MKPRTELKIVFMGTPEFGAIILEGLIKTNFKPILVVTTPEKTMEKEQALTELAVKKIAEKYDIPVLQPKKVLDIKSRILGIEPDLIIVASYNQTIPAEILEIPKNGVLKVHPSLLPKYRGPSPIQTAILNEDKETGITIILMDAKVDHGPILINRKWLIAGGTTYGELSKELADLGAEVLMRTIPRWIRDEITLKRQDEKKATYTKVIKKDDEKIDWSCKANYIEKQIRAFDPWPGAYCLWQTDGELRQIKILKARVLKAIDSKRYTLGKTLVAPQNELCVQCKEGFLIIGKLQLEGKKPMTAEELIRGHKGFIGTILK